MDITEIAEPLRKDLLRWCLSTSAERATIASAAFVMNPGVADLLFDLEADEELRVRPEVALLVSLTGDSD